MPKITQRYFSANQMRAYDTWCGEIDRLNLNASYGYETSCYTLAVINMPPELVEKLDLLAPALNTEQWAGGVGRAA